MNKLSVAYSEVKALNDKFRNKLLLTDEFYVQLKHFGFKLKNSVIISLIPEGGNTYSGVLIRHEGKVFEFDLDLDDVNYSQLDDVTNDFLSEYDRMKKVKPWMVEVVAYELFKELKY